MHMSARQAATGGLPLEEYDDSGVQLEIDRSSLGLGIQWVGARFTGDVRDGFRVGLEGMAMLVQAEGQTTEMPDGTYGGEIGEISANELGWGIFVQHQMRFSDSRTRFVARVTMQGISQNVAGSKDSGFGGRGAMFGVISLTERMNGLGWVIAGPLGTGRELPFAFTARVGAGIELLRGFGLVKREGLRVGLEGERLSEGLTQGGMGVLYGLEVFQDRGSSIRLLLRAGVRGVQDGVIPTQYRFGVGVGGRNRWGGKMSIDYGLVPFGELGRIHHMSVRFDLGGKSFRQ